MLFVTDVSSSVLNSDARENPVKTKEKEKKKKKDEEGEEEEGGGARR